LVPETLIAGLCATTAHELLGQSIVTAPFKALGELMAQCFRDAAATIELSQAA